MAMGDEIEVSELDPGGELVARVAALDVAKASAMVCTRVPGSGVRKRQEIRKVGATTAAILELADHLVCQGIELVVMESTSDYWRPFYYLLEDRGPAVWLIKRGLSGQPLQPLQPGRSPPGARPDEGGGSRRVNAAPTAPW